MLSIELKSNEFLYFCRDFYYLVNTRELTENVIRRFTIFFVGLIYGNILKMIESGFKHQFSIENRRQIKTKCLTYRILIIKISQLICISTSFYSQHSSYDSNNIFSSSMLIMTDK